MSELKETGYDDYEEWEVQRPMFTTAMLISDDLRIAIDQSGMGKDLDALVAKIKEALS